MLTTTNFRILFHLLTVVYVGVNLVITLVDISKANTDNRDTRFISRSISLPCQRILYSASQLFTRRNKLWSWGSWVAQNIPWIMHTLCVCFVLLYVYHLFLHVSRDVFTHILYGCFTGSEARIWLNACEMILKGANKNGILLNHNGAQMCDCVHISLVFHDNARVVSSFILAICPKRL